jgi:hypothetical protein
LYGSDLELSNLDGLAESKTLSVTGKERGAIYMVGRAVYASLFKNASNSNTQVSAISVNTTDLLSNPVVLNAVKEAANLLRERDWSLSII